jgi:hypothetical protein
MVSELGQRPARQRNAQGVGAGARDRDDPVALLGRRLLRTPAPIVRVQRPEPLLVERVDDLPDMRLVGTAIAAICGALMPVADASKIIAR